MFQITQDTLKRVGVFIFSTVLGRGTLLFLGRIGIHPEEWVATMLGAAYADPEAIVWMLAGISGLIGLAIWEIVQRRPTPTNGTPYPPRFPTPIASGASDAKPIPDMLVKEAAEHLAATKASWDATSDEVWAELRQAARDGRITVWGRPESAHLEQPYKPMEEIPSDHWRHYAFDFLRCMHSEDEVRCRSEPDDPKRYPLNKGYADLRVNTTQVQTSWTAKLPSNALTIEISDGAPFNTYTKRLHTKTHLIRICVVNGVYDHAVTNCQLRLEQITGPFSDRCPVKIKRNFTINGGERIHPVCRV
jgi:hypothetical protein